MFEHRKDGKTAFMIMDKLIVYDQKPPDNKPFHGIFHHLESGHSSWNAHSDYMEAAVKLFSQVYTAQNFQVNIWYYTSFYS